MESIANKKNRLLMFLGGIFITNAVVAELIGVKIFSLEQTLHLAPAQIHLFSNFILDFNLTAGVIIWPVVFITTDIINEYFGKQGVKQITFLTVGLIIYVFLVISIVTSLSPAGFWLEINQTDNSGNPFNIDFAYNKIFLQGLGIIIGSLIAFMIGQFLDVYIFQKLRKITGHRKIWLRATGSTLISQLVDSFVVLFVAFYIFGNPPWPFEQIIAVGIINYIYKFIIAIVLTPLLYLGHNIIDNYLGKNVAAKMVEEAAAKSNEFF
jgi:queuosine precursor transporter